MKEEGIVFRTIVDVPKWPVRMQAHHRFVLLGSCFAQYIGERFQSYGLNAVCNPLGVTYNPESIAVQVRQALTATAALPLFQTNGQWRCWWTGTLFSTAEENILRKEVQDAFSSLADALRKADFLFITLGTNVCYRLKDSGMTVANCHKMPGIHFEEVSLDKEACTNALKDMLEMLWRECPALRVVFTVSPYRYAKYGFHGSQLAKATLLLSVDELCQLYPEKTIYFPAYELLLDDLRDYRFYTDDMIHPAPAAISYIWQRMTENCMDKTMKQYLELYGSIRSALMHRPKQGDTADYIAFRKETEEKGRLLREKYGIHL